MGYESRYGVRALRRTLLDKVEEPLSELIIEQELSEGCNVVIDEHDEQILLRVA
jgi:ATP-dependent Clp protease ATP-binding subunit ClpC